jgi:membrane protein DedA with SNARE-associated domain
MGVTAFLAEHITHFIEHTGYISVFVLMTMESMVLPVPSEAVMPFAGFLIFQKVFTFPGVIVASVLGSITGSLASYALGLWGGRPFIRKFGKYLLLDMEELEATEKFFGKYGEITILLSRFIPVVRHLISIPAGTGRMNIVKFLVYTVIGAGAWNTFLAWAGFELRKNWEQVMKYSHILDYVVLAVLFALLVLFVVRQVRKHRKMRKGRG